MIVSAAVIMFLIVPMCFRDRSYVSSCVLLLSSLLVVLLFLMCIDWYVCFLLVLCVNLFVVGCVCVY